MDGKHQNIGLIDVDGHNFPNIALMKLSTYHKQQGDCVEWVNPLVGKYDKVYMSKVFDFTPDFVTCINAKEIIRGGTGYDLENKLPPEIESISPDYNLYGITNTAYGFLTRGCPRQCPFCIVSKKEGCKSYKAADLEQFWNGQKEIKLLDPNLLACKDKRELLQQLIESKSWVDFTQGIDIRFMDDSIIEQMRRIKVKMIHFAWDGVRDESKIQTNLKHFKQATGIDERKARVYVLTNFDTPHEYDLHRIYTLRELGYDPYIMIFDKEHAPHITKRLARWVNNKFIWRTCERFEDYR